MSSEEESGSEPVLSGELHVMPSGDALFSGRAMVLTVGDTLLLSGATLVLQRGHRYGLVGENGCGKTSLLEALRDVLRNHWQNAGGVAGKVLPWLGGGSAALLVLFGTAMAISMGIKAPLDYSVYSAAAAALLLARGAGASGRRSRQCAAPSPAPEDH